MTLYLLMSGVSDLQQQVLNRVQTQAQALLTTSRHSLARLETLGCQDGLALVLTIEQHLQQKSRLNIHFSASSQVTMMESSSLKFSSEILNAWLHDTQYRNGFQTGGFGGEKNLVRRTIWENQLWQSAYALGNCIDGSQAPKYAGLNVIPQAGGLDDPPGEFAFGDCYLQLKHHMLNRATFCLGDSGAVLAMGLPIKLATIDTISVALQDPESNMEDDDLCKLVIALTGEAESAPRLEYQVEAQIHSSIQFSDNVESLHMPIKYQDAQDAQLSYRNNKAGQLASKYAWDLRYYHTND